MIKKNYRIGQKTIIEDSGRFSAAMPELVRFLLILRYLPLNQQLPQQQPMKGINKMIKYIILILLLSGCTKDLDIDPMSTILKHTYKVITKGESND